VVLLFAASAYGSNWHFCDITPQSGYVRLRGQSGRAADIARGPILTHSGHKRLEIPQCNGC